jgi:hypothetical protein
MADNPGNSGDGGLQSVSGQYVLAFKLWSFTRLPRRPGAQAPDFTHDNRPAPT